LIRFDLLFSILILHTDPFEINISKNQKAYNTNSINTSISQLLLAAMEQNEQKLKEQRQGFQRGPPP
jgi:hypothetical protein